MTADLHLEDTNTAAKRFLAVALVGGGIASIVLGVIATPVALVLGVILIVAGLSSRWIEFDAPTLILVFLGLTLLIPSRLVFPQIGASGTPALLFGLGMLAAWMVSRTFSLLDTNTMRHPLRAAAALLMLSTFASYVWAAIHRFEGFSFDAVDRGLMVFGSFVGVALFIADSKMTRAQIYRVIDIMLVMGGIVAAIGVTQSLLRFDPVRFIQIPGLSASVDIFSIRERFGVLRVTSTAKHPIEFSVVIATMIPLAIARANTRWKEDRSVFFYGLLAVMMLSLATAVSRSGVVALLAAMFVLLPAMSQRQRSILAGMTPVILIVGRAAFPGVIGTLRGLFLNFGTDNSVSSRVSDYGAVEPYIAESPILGRGVRTFDAERFILLDNQILLTMIEAGIVGLVATFVFFAVGIGLARGERLRTAATDPDHSQLAQALAAGMVANLVSFATFDATHYSMVMGLTAVLAGLAACLWCASGGYDNPAPLNLWAVRVREYIRRS
ncbi:MAG: O-antigen ligase family protein [Actinomycetota bacterium]